MSLVPYKNKWPPTTTAEEADKQWKLLERSVTIYRRQRVPLIFKLVVVLGVLNAVVCAWTVTR